MASENLAFSGMEVFSYLTIGMNRQLVVIPPELLIDKINNTARYNLIDTKYHQMAFRLARGRCDCVLFGNPWSNKSEW